MTILGLNGSPRKGGNTELLLDAFFSGVTSTKNEAEILNLSSLRIIGCRECLDCFQNGICPINDDMTPLYEKIISARAVVLASPIFFYGITAWAKAPVDRCQALWARKYVLKTSLTAPGTAKKKGFFISVGGTKGAKMFDGAILTARYFFDAIDAGYDGELLFRKIDAKLDILNEPGALEAAFQEGVKLAQSIPLSHPERGGET